MTYFTSALGDIVNEIRILSALSESGVKNIVRYYENDIIDTPSPKTYDIYILMEYLTPLDSYIEQHPFTVKDVIRLGKDILNALIACHAQKIIHRDIKDDNIFVSPEGDFKLGDFGVSKALKDKSRAESVKGTPNFIAPEVYLGKEKYDNTVDLYSLGIVLYKLLNRSRNPFLPMYPDPYNTNDEDKAFEERMSGKTPEMPLLARNALGAAVLKAIMNRENRYNSAEEFLEALQAAERTLDGGALTVVVCDTMAVGAATVAGTGNKTVTAAKVADETVGASYFNQDITIDHNEKDRHLFDTISVPAAPTEIPQSSAATAVQQTPAATAQASEPLPVRPLVDPPPKRKKLHRKARRPVLRRVVMCLLPPILLLLYIGFYVVLIPALYDQTLSFFDWLFADVNNILNALQDANNILIPTYAIVLLIILQYVLLGALASSLFVVARELHRPKVLPDNSIKYTGKTAQTMLDRVCMTLQHNGAHDAAIDVQTAKELLQYSKGLGLLRDAKIVAVEQDICAVIDALLVGLTEGEGASPDQLSRLAFELKQRVEMRDNMIKK